MQCVMNRAVQAIAGKSNLGKYSLFVPCTFDITCGSGGMLVQTRNYLTRNGENPSNLMLSGQERNLSTWAICKLNMFLHGAG